MSWTHPQRLMEERMERMEEALKQIATWGEAIPLGEGVRFKPLMTAGERKLVEMFAQIAREALERPQRDDAAK